MLESVSYPINSGPQHIVPILDREAALHQTPQYHPAHQGETIQAKLEALSFIIIFYEQLRKQQIFQ